MQSSRVKKLKVGFFIEKIELNLSPELFVPKFFPYLFDYSHRWEFYMGGAGSGKSIFIQQKLIIRALTDPGIRILICRKTAESLRESTFAAIKQQLIDWKIYDLVKINQTNMTIVYPNGSQMIFIGLDREGKLLSLADISCIFVEEAFDVEQDFVEQLNLRMRGKKPNQQIILAWNPVSQDSWLYTFSVVNPPEDSIFIHSTFEDNPFLSEVYKENVRSLKNRNPAKWRIYGLGEWGIEEEGLVFKNWREESFDINELLKNNFELRCGSDLGYVDPTTIISSLYDRANNRIYVIGEFYQRGCQLDEVAVRMEKLIGKKAKCYMDSAEPRSIDFFRRKGFNTLPCLKGPNSVASRLTFLQNHEIIIHSSCQNLIREMKNFSYIKDKKTSKYTENTTHEYSHAIDALGYAYSDIYVNNRLGSFDKKLLGL